MPQIRFINTLDDSLEDYHLQCSKFQEISRELNYGISNFTDQYEDKVKDKWRKEMFGHHQKLLTDASKTVAERLQEFSEKHLS